jgi:hypothetical protein
MNESSPQSSKPTPAEIAERAYRLYELEGRVNGRDVDHWLRAESQLIRERQASLAERDRSTQPRAATQDRRASKPLQKTNVTPSKQAVPMAGRAAV